MTTLYSLAQRLQVGDNLQLASPDPGSEKQKPKEVTRIEAEEDLIRVEAEGPQDGKYAFWVDSDGNSEASYEGQVQGPVDIARLVVHDDRYIST